MQILHLQVLQETCCVTLYRHLYWCVKSISRLLFITSHSPQPPYLTSSCSSRSFHLLYCDTVEHSKQGGNIVGKCCN